MSKLAACRAPFIAGLLITQARFVSADETENVQESNKQVKSEHTDVKISFSDIKKKMRSQKQIY